MHTRAWNAAAAVSLGIALTAAPLAASAATIYPPTGSCTTEKAAVEANEIIRFSCRSTTFSTNEPVTITVTGENGASARVGMMRFGIGTASSVSTSSSDGALRTVEIALPADARGTYNIAAVSPSSVGGTAAVTVAAAEGGLPITGLGGSSALGFLVGGGALLAAGLAIGVAAFVRHRQSAD